MPLYAVCSTDENVDSEEEDAEELEEADDEEGSGPSLVTRIYIFRFDADVVCCEDSDDTSMPKDPFGAYIIVYCCIIV